MMGVTLLLTQSLGPVGWGWLAFALCVQGYFINIASSSMRSVILDRVVRYPDRFNETWTVYVVLSATIGVALAIACCAASIVWCESISIATAYSILALGSIANSFVPIPFFEARLNPVLPVRVSAALDLGILTAVFCLIELSSVSLIWASILFAAKWTATSIVQTVILWRNVPTLRFAISRQEILALAHSIPHQAIFAVMCAIPVTSGVLFAQFAIGTREAGLMSMATMVQQVFVLLSVQLHRIVQPRMANSKAIQVSELLDYNWRFPVFLLVLGGAAWLSSSVVVLFFFSSDYRPCLGVLPWTILAGGITSASYMASFRLTISKRESDLTWIALGVGAMHLLASCVVFVFPRIEYLALCSVVSSTLSLVLLIRAERSCGAT